MENKNEVNENKIILGNFNCTMERDDRNKTLYVISIVSCQNSSWIMDWRENPDFSEFIRYNRSSGTTSTLDRVYTDIKMVSNTKINHIILLLLTDALQKLKLENIGGTLK